MYIFYIYTYIQSLLVIFGNLLAFYLIYTNVFHMLLLKFLNIDLSWGCTNQLISIENSNIYFYNWKKYLKFLNFFVDLKCFSFNSVLH